MENGGQTRSKLKPKKWKGKPTLPSSCMKMSVIRHRRRSCYYCLSRKGGGHLTIHSQPRDPASGDSESLRCWPGRELVHCVSSWRQLSPGPMATRKAAGRCDKCVQNGAHLPSLSARASRAGGGSSTRPT